MSKIKVVVSDNTNDAYNRLKEYLKGEKTNLTFEELMKICQEIPFEEYMTMVGETFKELSGKLSQLSKVDDEIPECVQDMIENNGANRNDDECLNCEDYDCIYNPVQQSEDDEYDCDDCDETDCVCHPEFDEDIEIDEDDTEDFISMSLDEKIEEVVPEIDKFYMGDISSNMSGYCNVLEDYEKSLGERIINLGKIISVSSQDDLKTINYRMMEEYDKLTEMLQRLHAQTDILITTKTYTETAMDMLNDYMECDDVVESDISDGTDKVGTILTEVKKNLTSEEIDKLVTALQCL